MENRALWVEERVQWVGRDKGGKQVMSTLCVNLIYKTTEVVPRMTGRGAGVGNGQRERGEQMKKIRQ